MISLAGRNVLVIGLGKSGLAAVRFCLERGAIVAASDSRPAEEVGDIGVPVYGQEPEVGDGFDLLVQSPGVPLEIPLFQRARQRGATIAGEVELAASALRGRTVGITGANGKTTTTALIGHIFREAGLPTIIAGNIGTPITALTGESRPDGWNVLELSSFQLESICEFRAQIAVVLNITPDHLDRHGSMERYIDAKARLVETQQPEDHAVLNAGERNTRALANRTRAKVIWFNASAPADDAVAFVDGKIWLGTQPLMRSTEIPLVGRHNVDNVMAAAAAAWLAGIEPGRIAAAVRTFPGVAHRIEFVRDLDGVRYYNDSKATNVDATEKAVAAFPGNLWIILGGKDKHSDYRPLAGLLAPKAKGILLIGAAAPIIRDHLASADPSLPLTDCGTLDRAVHMARAAAAVGDVVLLSPACASFDQFNNYEHRGDTFKDLVRNL